MSGRDTERFNLAFMVLVAAGAGVVATALWVLVSWMTSPASARASPTWSQAVYDACHDAPEGADCHQALSVMHWFQNLMQPDNPYMSCCGEADAFEADTFEVEGDHYVAIITNGKGVLPEGKRIDVPNAKMKWDAGNPTGHGIIFIGSSGQIYCYVAPGGV